MIKLLLEPRFVLGTVISFLFSSYGAGQDIRSIALKSSQSRPQLFSNLTSTESGVDFVNPIEQKHSLSRLYVAGYASGGLAIGDLDGNGLPDIFCAGGPVANALFLQKAPFRFEKSTEGIDGSGSWAAGVAMVDIDQDGDLDLYVCHYDSPNHLYINETAEDGPVVFKERAADFGLDLKDACFMPHFADYDRDGDLDVFITGYQFKNPEGRPEELPIVERNGRYSVKPEYRKYYGIVTGFDGRQTFTNVGRADYLLQSNASELKGAEGQIRFQDVTAKAGMSGQGVGNSAIWWDYNGDGWLDLYVANDFKVADQMYHNNGDGTFTDIVEEVFPHTTWFSMGSDVGDLNNDGRMDLLVSDMAGTSHYRSKVSMGEMHTNREFLAKAHPKQYMRNALFINTGTTRFLEGAYLAGVATTDWTWAAKLADFDNDGRLDMYFTNGASRMFNHSDFVTDAKARVGKTEWDLWKNTEERIEENLAFKNEGDFKFTDASSTWGLKKASMSYSAAVGDLDRDGDLELVVANLNEPISIYRNNSQEKNRVTLRLKGKTLSYGTGAQVRLETKGGIQVRTAMPMTGFLSSNDPHLHFGLGEDDIIQKLTIDWPSGVHQVFAKLKAGFHYVVEEGAATKKPVPDSMLTEFEVSKEFPALRHQEKQFDDYERQPLLPYKHSQLGPGIAVADLDLDGDQEIYLGRGAGGKRAIYQNGGKGILTVPTIAPFEDESAFEDMGVLFLDADIDGDQDLFVVSGGVEGKAAMMRDRLYLNDGKGAFVKSAAEALPPTSASGSVAVAADFDRDGDLDVFVGGRVVPGEYPSTPQSCLLINESKGGVPAFRDATKEISPDLARVGLVTSALWSDLNNDGWQDLIVTLEWGAITVLMNKSVQNGDRKLIDQTATAGLDALLGWWNGIDGRDLDGDGDIDYVVTNFGLNTKYKASSEKPELLYYGEFDGTGRRFLIEAKFEGQTCFPRRGLSCSSHAMPFIREKVKTFHNFGVASLDKIYTANKLKNALQLKANTLESGMLINNSAKDKPALKFVPLPRLAQIAPSFGVAILDYDADGHPDCFLAQNFWSPQLETGRMDGGLSVILKGPEMRPLMASESGISVRGDAKGVSVVDFSEDGSPDLLVAVNDGEVVAYENRKRPHLCVRLSGGEGNPTAVGARVTFTPASGPKQTAEIYAGSGYLSQRDSAIYFGSAGAGGSLTVVWPDATESTHSVESGTRVLRIPKL